MTTVCWRAASASERGSSHADGAPNQDAVGFARAVDADGAEVWLAAVSDGHGGRRYVRSDVGARLAVRCALDVLTEAVPDPLWATGAVDEVLREAMPRVVEVPWSFIRRQTGSAPVQSRSSQVIASRLGGSAG